jgi:ABC-type phosphate transport system substrate-binding protein
MKDEEIAALKPGVKILHVPTALGAVVVIYNVPDAAAINLDADTIAGPVRGHDHELERPEDRRAQLGRDPARPLP